MISSEAKMDNVIMLPDCTGESKRGTLAYFVTVAEVVGGERLIWGDFQRQGDSGKSAVQKKIKTNPN